MAEVVGFLRRDLATWGEIQVNKCLSENLPDEYKVYIECPLPGNGILRFPDFSIVAEYGVIILEVKDWIMVEKCDRLTAVIRTRENESRTVTNPVLEAREFATLLASQLERVPDLINFRQKLKVGWGYAAVFPNLPGPTVTRLGTAWGLEKVLCLADLSPELIQDRLKSTIPPHHLGCLSAAEVDCVRAVINPTTWFSPPGRPPVILDKSQEALVNEPVRQPVESTPAETPASPLQEALLPVAEPTAPEPSTEVVTSTAPAKKVPFTLEDLASQTAVRLVRGVAGSGKTLVLTQRARYLAASFPEWRILVLTFNDSLAESLAAALLRIPNIHVKTFYGLCRDIMRNRISWSEPITSEGWLKYHESQFPLVGELGADFIHEEFKWLLDTLTIDREAYLAAERRGRGSGQRLSKFIRTRLFDLFEVYRAYLLKEKKLDWSDIPRLLLEGVGQGILPVDPYNAILVDEAQDFAPAWFRLLGHNLAPAGALFLADDPAQSIYRYFSWRQKGIEVVGRTRHLRVPYRNTYEIYQAAFELIRSDDALRQQFEEEGQLILPDLDPTSMRHGKKPLLRRFPSFAQEAAYISSQINALKTVGIRPEQVAVLNRHRKGKAELEKVLKGLGVNVDTYHHYKGLEFEAVFLTGIQDAFPQAADPQKLTEERRLVYMAMTRARQQLFLTGCGAIPQPLRCILPFVEQV